MKKFVKLTLAAVVFAFAFCVLLIAIVPTPPAAVQPTAVPVIAAATELPAPTAQPTETAAPTETPAPSATTTPIPTSAFVPATPVPQEERTPTLSTVFSAITGLRVSRTRLQTIYEQQGFVFEEGAPVNGQPQVIGKHGQYHTSVQLIGPVENVISVSIIAPLTYDATEGSDDKVRASYVLALILATMPDWKDGHSWVLQQLDLMAKSSDPNPEYQTTVNGRMVKLMFLDVTDGKVLILSIEVE